MRRKLTLTTLSMKCSRQGAQRSSTRTVSLSSQFAEQTLRQQTPVVSR